MFNYASDLRSTRLLCAPGFCTQQHKWLRKVMCEMSLLFPAVCVQNPDSAACIELQDVFAELGYPSNQVCGGWHRC